jgi:RNA polymerase sigma-70 factor (ECF subfamily)
VSSDSFPTRCVEDAERADQLRAALGQIPPKQAEAFYLHCVEEWSYQEISQHLDVSISAVGVLLHRARKRLRQRLSGLRETADGNKLPGDAITPFGAGSVGPGKEHS